MAYTAADLATIEAAIAKGAKKVKMSNGNEIEYQSLADMRAVRELIRQELGLSGTKTGFVVFNANTGLE